MNDNRLDVAELSSEHRNQTRIKVDVDVHITLVESQTTLKGKLHNLSWGGAYLLCDEPSCKKGDAVVLAIPWIRDETISIRGKILRFDELYEGGYGAAIRFATLTTEDEKRLTKVLEMLLSGGGGGRRKDPRLARRLEITFFDPIELQAVLEDISQGGVQVMVPDSFEEGQSVMFVLTGLPEFSDVSLRGRVIRQSPVKFGRLEVFNTTLKFEHPQVELKVFVERMLVRLTKLKKLRRKYNTIRSSTKRPFPKTGT